MASGTVLGRNMSLHAIDRRIFRPNRLNVGKARSVSSLFQAADVTTGPSAAVSLLRCHLRGRDEL